MAITRDDARFLIDNREDERVQALIRDLDDEDYAFLTNEARVQSAPPVEEPGMAGEAGRQLARLQTAAQTGTEPTTRGFFQPQGGINLGLGPEESLPGAIAGRLEQGLASARLPAAALTRAGTSEPVVAAEDPNTGTRILVPGGRTSAVDLAKQALGQVAGLAEFPVVFPIQAVSWIAKHFDPKLREQGEADVRQGLTDFYDIPKTATDAVMDTPEFKRKFRADPVGTSTKVLLAGAIAAGGMTKVAGRGPIGESSVPVGASARTLARRNAANAEAAAQVAARRTNAELVFKQRAHDLLATPAPEALAAAEARLAQPARTEAALRQEPVRGPQPRPVEPVIEGGQIVLTDTRARSAGQKAARLVTPEGTPIAPLTDIPRDSLGLLMPEVAGLGRADFVNRARAEIEGAGIPWSDQLQGFYGRVYERAREGKLNLDGRRGTDALILDEPAPPEPVPVEALPQRNVRVRITEAEPPPDRPTTAPVATREGAKTLEAGEAPAPDAMTPDAPAQIAHTADNPTPARTTTEAEYGAAASAHGRQTADFNAGMPFNSPEAMTWAQRMLDGIKHVWETRVGTRPTNEIVDRMFTSFLDKVTGFITSRGLAHVRALTHFRRLRTLARTDGAKGGAVDARVTLFSRYLLHDRAEALEARRSAVVAELTKQQRIVGDGSLDPISRMEAEMAIQEMTRPDIAERIIDGANVEEAIREHRMPKLDEVELAAAEADPIIQEMARYWREKVVPELEAGAEAAGIKSRLQSPRGLYHTVRWYRSFDQVPKAFRGHDPEHTFLQRGGGARASGSPAPPPPFNVRRGTASAARKATGVAPDTFIVEDNLYHQLAGSFSDRTVARTRRALYEAVKAHDVPPNPVTGLVDETKPYEYIDRKGKRHVRTFKVEPIFLEQMAGRGLTKTTRVNVPAPIKAAWDRAMSQKILTDNIAFRVLSNFSTAMAVAIPAEATMHGMGVLFATLRIPAIAKTRLGRELETFGGAAAKIAVTMREATRLSGPRLERLMRDATEAGALRLSGFEGATASEGSMGAWTTNILTRGRSPVANALKLPFKLIKDVVFGFPGDKAGLWGLETRLRLIAFEGVRRADPTLTNAQAGRIVNNAFGTYVQRLAPDFVEALRPIYPFARARVALTKSGLNTLAGRDLLGNYSWRMHMNLVATATGLAILGKTLDDSGRWPWEVPGFNGKTLYFVHNGKRIGLPLRNLYQPLQRAMSLGFADPLESFLKGERSPDQLVTDMRHGVGNYFASWAGPFAKSLGVTTLGVAPYVTESGRLYRVEREVMAGSKVKIPGTDLTVPMGKTAAGLKASIGSVFPAVEKIAHGFEPGVTNLPENEFWKWTYIGADLFGFAPQLGDPFQEDREAASLQMRIRGQWQDTANAIFSEAMRLPAAQRMDHVRARTEVMPDVVVFYRGRPLPARLAATLLILDRMKGEDIRLGRRRGMQEVNVP